MDRGTAVCLIYKPFTAGEPIFSGPPIKSHLYQSYLDCGTYITFLQDGMTCYGRVLSTSTLLSTGLITINKYLDIEDISQIAHGPTILPLRNAYVEEKELVQTSIFIHLPPSCITGVVFVFKNMT